MSDNADGDEGPYPSQFTDKWNQSRVEALLDHTYPRDIVVLF